MRVELGRVAGAHALAGELRVQYFGDGPDEWARFEGVWLATRPDDPAARYYAVESLGRGRAGEVRLGLAGVTDREAAEALRGQLVLGDAGALEPLGEDEYYWYQLVGCEVVTEAGETVGRVREIWETGAHDVLVVDPEAGGRPVLVPTAREIMRHVDVEARRIVIEALPGLLDPDTG